MNTCCVLCVSAFSLMNAASPNGATLFSDPAFAHGFNVTAARHPAPKIELGALRFPDGPDEAPVWRLAQWGSEHLLQPGLFSRASEGRWVAETAGKRVVVERGPEGDASILLEVNGGAEYAGQYRKQGESWPHLLIEQKFEPGIAVVNAGRLQLEFRVDHCHVVPGMESGLEPGLHTAQVSAYFTVHNITAGSPDHKGMIWFGIPLFDARHAVPPGHQALDTAPGGGGKFICTMAGKRFWQGNTGDGQWRALDADLAAFLREALQISQEHGHLKESRIEDLALTSFNLGWEVPGPYNAGIEIRRLGMRPE